MLLLLQVALVSLSIRADRLRRKELREGDENGEEEKKESVPRGVTRDEEEEAGFAFATTHSNFTEKKERKEEDGRIAIKTISSLLSSACKWQEDVAKEEKRMREGFQFSPLHSLGGGARFLLLFYVEGWEEKKEERYKSRSRKIPLFYIREIRIRRDLHIFPAFSRSPPPTKLCCLRLFLSLPSFSLLPPPKASTSLFPEICKKKYKKRKGNFFPPQGKKGKEMDSNVYWPTTPMKWKRRKRKEDEIFINLEFPRKKFSFCDDSCLFLRRNKNLLFFLSKTWEKND